MHHWMRCEALHLQLLKRRVSAQVRVVVVVVVATVVVVVARWFVCCEGRRDRRAWRGRRPFQDTKRRRRRVDRWLAPGARQAACHRTHHERRGHDSAIDLPRAAGTMARSCHRAALALARRPAGATPGAGRLPALRLLERRQVEVGWSGPFARGELVEVGEGAHRRRPRSRARHDELLVVAKEDQPHALREHADGRLRHHRGPVVMLAHLGDDHVARVDAAAWIRSLPRLAPRTAAGTWHRAQAHAPRLQAAARSTRTGNGVKGQE